MTTPAGQRQRAEAIIRQEFCLHLDDNGEPDEVDILTLVELQATARQEARKEAALVVQAYIKARDDSRYMTLDDDCERFRESYRVYADAADALDRLASEGG